MAGNPTIERLERWTLFGATWRLAELGQDHAIVELCECTGELVERLRSDDPTVIEYVRQNEPDHRLAS